MDNSIYLSFKRQLKEVADNTQTNDKPMRRQILNDFTDNLLRDLSHNTLTEQISEKQYNLYANWLNNYCAKRHEK